MKNLKSFKMFFMIMSSAGVLFSGYMSGVKLFSDTCAFGETCPLFLGMPACYIGFILFLSLFLISLAFVLNKKDAKIISKKLFLISLLGVVYSLNFAIPELPSLFKNGFSAYLLGLPTCVMGSLFFIVIFIGAIIFYKKVKMQ